jgi:hypothetical protein
MLSSYEEFHAEAEEIIDLGNGVTFAVVIVKGRSPNWSAWEMPTNDRTSLAPACCQRWCLAVCRPTSVAGCCLASLASQTAQATRSISWSAE